jgi:hypothetical protein
MAAGAFSCRGRGPGAALARIGDLKMDDEHDEHDEPIVGMYEVLDALEEALKASDPAKPEALAEAIDGYHEDFPEDFHWAVGAQSPVLLHHLVMVIDSACRPEAQSKPRAIVRLVDRRPEGNA